MNEIVQQNGGGAPAEPSGSDILSRRVEELARSVGQIGQTVQSFAATRQQTEQEQQIQTLLRDAETKAKQAEDKLRAARESGDFEQELTAQREFARAVAEQTRVEGEVRVYKARQDQLRNAPPPPDETGLRAFQERNRWFGTDQEMTQVAIAFAKEIERAGVVKGSPAYFQEVQRRMSERFPDRMGGGTPPVAGGGSMGGGGGSPSGSVRFTPEQLQTWRSMGIDTSNAENLKALAVGREEAVRRNLLPSTPPTNLGRVVMQR